MAVFLSRQLCWSMVCGFFLTVNTLAFLPRGLRMRRWDLERGQKIPPWVKCWNRSIKEVDRPHLCFLLKL